jgi:hypothetical protein
MRVHKVNLDTTLLQQLEQWDPVNAGRFHRDRPNLAALQPICERVQITRKRAEPPYWLPIAIWGDCHKNLFRSNIDASRIGLEHRCQLLPSFSPLRHTHSPYPEDAARGANPSTLLIEIAALSHRRHQ